MRHLRRFNESIKEDISDILLELNDMGFYTEVSENSELNDYFIFIEKEPLTRGSDSILQSSELVFKISEISESLIRLVDYLADTGLYLQYIIINNVNIRTQPNSVFDNRHPEQVIKDISDNKLSKYYSDKSGSFNRVSSLNPDKTEYIQLYFRK